MRPVDASIKRSSVRLREPAFRSTQQWTLSTFGSEWSGSSSSESELAASAVSFEDCSMALYNLKGLI